MLREEADFVSYIVIRIRMVSADRNAVEMKPGDCINIPVGVKHWHGAAPDSWFSHLAIEVPGKDGSNEWLEAIDDEYYHGITRKV